MWDACRRLVRGEFVDDAGNVLDHTEFYACFISVTLISCVLFALKVSAPCTHG